MIRIEEQETVFLRGDLEIRVAPIPDTDAVRLLGNTVYGTAGIRYLHTGQDEKLRHIAPAVFFHLYQAGNLVGFFCLDPRMLSFPNGTVQGYYGRYFAIDALVQGQGLGNLLIEQATAFIEKKAPVPCLIYVYVEQQNIRSVRTFLRNQYAKKGNFRTYVFRRIFPKKRLNACQTAPEQITENKLPVTQAGNRFVTLRNIGYGNGYYTFRDGDRAVGYVHATSVRWQFKAMPGISGAILMHIVPKLPVLNRIFRPDYAFLAIEGLFVPDKKDTAAVLESLLFHLRKNSIILQVDDQAGCFSALPGMGLLSGYQQGVATGLYVKTFGLEPAFLSATADQANYVSAFDFT